MSFDVIVFREHAYGAHRSGKTSETSEQGKESCALKAS